MTDTHNDTGLSQQQNRLRYAFVDVAVSFSHLPSLLNSTAEGDIESASQFFLVQGLNAQAATTVVDVRVNLTSKTVESIRTTFMGNNVTNNDTMYRITTALDIEIEYKLKVDDEQLNDMEARIRMLFLNEWDVLRDLLMVLDGSYFEFLVSITLVPKGDDTLSAPVNLTDDNFTHNDNNSDNNEPIIAERTIIALLVVGAWVLISVLVMIPLVCRIARNRRKGTHEGLAESNSSTGDSGEANTASELDDGDVASAKVFNDNDIEGLSSEMESRNKEDAVFVPGDDDDDKRCEEIVVAEDMVQNPPSGQLVDLKTKKYTAEERLLATFTVYKDASGSHVKTETSFIPINSTSVDTKYRENDLEYQMDLLRTSSKINQDRINESIRKQQLQDHPILPASLQNDVITENKTIPEGYSVEVEHRSYWITPVTKEREDDSVSTLSNDSSNVTEEEMITMDVPATKEDGVLTTNQNGNKHTPSVNPNAIQYNLKEPLAVSSSHVVPPSLQKEYY